ncbi:MAG TPA: sulfatase-like hydrolase/transferase, partial [Cytophagales bacterium]
MRKNFVPGLICFLLATAGFAQTPAPRPNIVFILADDLGYGDVGAFGATDIRTPHIDGLAQRGIKFTQFYAPSPVCSPTRAG